MRSTFKWYVGRDDFSEAHGIVDGGETFTRLYIRYADPGSGEEGVVRAENLLPDYPLLERIVPQNPPGAPMTRSEAQELADDAVAVLGGKPVERHWVKIAADQGLRCSDDEERTATEIQPGDTILATLALEEETLYVFGITKDDDALLLSLSDKNDHDRRVELDLRLAGLEHG